jgi:chromate transporter
MSLWSIFTTMVLAGLSAVGGGWGTIAAAQSAWVGPGMLSPQQFAWAVSVGQITPGPFSVLVVALGWQLRGAPGALVALVGIVLPTWIVCVIAGRGMERYRQAVVPFSAGIPWILAALAGSSGIKMALPLGLHWWEIGVGVAAAVAVAWKKVEPLWVLGAAAAIGAGMAFLK